MPVLPLFPCIPLLQMDTLFSVLDSHQLLDPSGQIPAKQFKRCAICSKLLEKLGILIKIGTNYINISKEEIIEYLI